MAGSFAVSVAKIGSRYPENTAEVAAILDAETKSGLDSLEPYAAFKARTFEHRSKMLELLTDLRSRGARYLDTAPRQKAMSSCNSVASSRICFPPLPKSIPTKSAASPRDAYSLVSEVTPRLTTRLPSCVAVAFS